MYDRLTGSTTMVISSGGTTVPGSPTRPEFLKAKVYLPPAFVTHHPDLHRHLIDIIQHYIETVGVRTVTMWTQKARRDLGYTFTQVGIPRQNPTVNTFPSPDSNSAHYTFLGQPYRITEDPSASPVRPPSQASSADSYAYAFGEDPDESTLAIIDLQQEKIELREQIFHLQQRISALEEESKVTNLQTHDRIAFLEGKIQRYAENTSAPVRNVTTKPAKSKVPLTPFRYGSVTPSHAAPTRSQNSLSPGIFTGSHTPFTSQAPPSASNTAHPSTFMDENNTDGLASPRRTVQGRN
jgi:hypothetical protein